MTSVLIPIRFDVHVARASGQILTAIKVGLPLWNGIV